MANATRIKSGYDGIVARADRRVAFTRRESDRQTKARESERRKKKKTGPYQDRPFPLSLPLEPLEGGDNVQKLLAVASLLNVGDLTAAAV